jgi:hypothetical protein
MKKWLTPVVIVLAVLAVGFYTITGYMARKKSEEILQSFKTVNADLDSANKQFALTNNKTYLYAQLMAAATPVETTQLELLEQAMTAYNKYLDSLKQAFRAGMTSEQNVTFSREFFQQNGNGNKLFWKMQDIKKVLVSVAASDSIRQQVNDMGLQIVNGEPVNDPAAFTTAYFSNTPAVGVLTILNSFQNSSNNSELAILKDYSNLVQLRKTK